MIKMIPPVPTSAVMMPTPKQKIGFSIESIVGNDAAPSTNNNNNNNNNQQTLTKSEAQTRHEIQSIINRLHNSSNSVHVTATNLSDSLNKSNFLKGSYSPPPVQTRLSPDNHISSVKNDRSPSLPPSSTLQSQSPTPPQSTPASSSATLLQQQQSGLSSHNKPPLVVPGMPAALVRPFPVSAPNIPDIKALPPYINTPEIVPPQHNPHLIAAAQFQMAAALQAGHVLGPGAGLHPHSPFLPNHTVPRDTYPLYPWLLSRHGRIFPHRFPGNFLLQPFRKPKRIRTAFSPSQLLKLEHAFESNQYVVGAERKALAQSLNLSETQVKVWFQNRRTKHKRMQQEDEKSPNSNSNGQQQNSSNSTSDKNNSNNNTSCDEDDDELIDMEMDDCPSDDELDASATSPHHLQHHHQLQQQQQQQQQHQQLHHHYHHLHLQQQQQQQQHIQHQQ